MSLFSSSSGHRVTVVTGHLFKIPTTKPTSLQTRDQFLRVRPGKSLTQRFIDNRTQDYDSLRQKIESMQYASNLSSCLITTLEWEGLVGCVPSDDCYHIFLLVGRWHPLKRLGDGILLSRSDDGMVNLVGRWRPFQYVGLMMTPQYTHCNLLRWWVMNLIWSEGHSDNICVVRG